MPSFCSALLFPPHHQMFRWLAIVRTAIWYFQFSSSLPKGKNIRDACWIVCIWSLSLSNHLRPDHAPIVTVIQSEHLKHSISQRNQSAKHLNSGCFGISRVDGSALSKGWRSGPEAFRAGLFFFFAHEKPVARCRVYAASINLQYKESSIFWFLAGAIKSVTRNL